MHALTRRELERLKAAHGWRRIRAEQAVVLEGGRVGRFDFLVEDAAGQRIGVEVLNRPTKGKMKEKLAYRAHVDRFVFVLPAHALAFYRKKPKRAGRALASPKAFPAAFADRGLHAWLLDTATGAFARKARFTQLFYVEKNRGARLRGAPRAGLPRRFFG